MEGLLDGDFLLPGRISLAPSLRHGPRVAQALAPALSNLPPPLLPAPPHCTPPCLAASSGKSSWTVSPLEALAKGIVLTLAKGRGSFPGGCLP